MIKEILNIQEHKKQLVLKALNKYKNQHEAAKELGISQSGLNRMTAKMKIFKRDGEYIDRRAVAKSFAP